MRFGHIRVIRKDLEHMASDNVAAVGKRLSEVGVVGADDNKARREDEIRVWRDGENAVQILLRQLYLTKRGHTVDAHA